MLLKMNLFISFLYMCGMYENIRNFPLQMLGAMIFKRSLFSSGAGSLKTHLCMSMEDQFSGFFVFH